MTERRHTTTGRTGSVWVVSDEAVLSSAVGAGLVATGWPAVSVVAERRLAELARAVARLGRMVLVADRQGRLPDPRPALVGRAPPMVVAVGTKSALPALADAVERLAAVAAVDADQPFVELIRLIDRILRGVDARVVAQVDARVIAAALREREQEARRFERLTHRELEVLGALVLGQAASDVARAWQVSLTTVRAHIRGVLAKTGVGSQLAAVALAYRSCRERTVLDRIRRHCQF